MDIERPTQPGQWPQGYFEQVFGQWQGEPLERSPQGEYETNELRRGAGSQMEDWATKTSD